MATKKTETKKATEARQEEQQKAATREVTLVIKEGDYQNLMKSIRIHAGNRASDTRGCIIVGHHLAGELMIRSADTLARVIELLYDLQERGNVYLQIYHRKR